MSIPSVSTPTPDELIAKGICPVKSEFVRNVVKTVQDAVTGAGKGAEIKSKNKQKKVGWA